MSERLIDPKNIGSKSKSKILKKFRRVFNVPLVKEIDLIEYLQSIGVKTRKRKPKNVVIALWSKAGLIYNQLLDDEREVENKRKIARNKKDAIFVKSVLEFARRPTTKTRDFALPRDEVMSRILTQLISVKNKIKMEVGNVAYTLNIKFLGKMIENINDGEWLVSNIDDSRTSDEQAVYDLMQTTNFRLIILDDNVIRKKKGGAFFKHTHNIPDLDLTQYQISYTGDDYNQYKESCFIHAVIKFFANEGIDADAKICRAKSKMTTRTMTAIVIEKVAVELGVSISIKDERDIKTGNNKARTDIKNKGCDLTIPLGLIGEHYFLIEEVAITKYALVNFKELKDVDRWNEVYNKNTKRDKRRFINSYDVISYMYDNDEIYLTELDPKNILGSIHYDTGMDIDVYDVMEGDCKEVEYNDRSINKLTGEKKEEEIVCYFDFESTTNGDKHRAYLVVYYTDKMSEPKCIEGVFCGKKMLQEVARLHDYKPIRFIAHNVKYDFQFLYEHLYQVSKIQRGSMLLSARGDFYVDNEKCKFNFVDSYSFITTKLCKFPDMFGIKNIEKEIMPYCLWNTNTIKDKRILLTDCVEYCDRQVVSNNIGREVSIEEKDDYYHSFVDKAKEWDCIIYDDYDEDNNSIDIMKYSKMYCIVDVEILKQGYTKFRGWIKEVCGLDINHYITLPSVADAYMKKSGVYKDCYEVSGSQLVFLQKCMVGGRTMTCENEKFNFTNDKYKLLDDLDAVSLYPSAMKRMGGYLKGCPKVIKNKKYKFLQSVDGYFVEIKINKVGINKKFPLMSCITDKGIRLWTNDMVGKTIFVDKFALEDLIQFQKIEFNIIKGYYYDEGRNYQIGETIEHLFNTRLKKKEEGNAIEQIYKLLMNSAYGRTLLKPFEEEKVYVKAKQEERHLVRHYDSIIRSQKLHDDSFEITQLKPIVSHYNLVHIGCEVLSMSKRIMNEVMCLAEDIDVDIYYQDTDSTHTPVDKIPDLEEAYFKKYGRVLCGDKMGQFNCDFDSKKLNKKYLKIHFNKKYGRLPTDDEMNDKKIKKEFKIGIVSEESVFLGKKCYTDKLIVKGDDGGKLYGVDYHIRMKGVSGDAIMDKLCEEDIDVMELYDRLHSGEAIEFDLCCRGMKACFESMKDGTMTTKDKFPRVIKFSNEEEEEEEE
jgi:hypothetical protein